MPIPSPRKGESQSDFVGRCMHEASKSPDRTNEQNVAICLQAWRETHPSAPPPPSGKQVKQDMLPDDDESYEDFMDRCGEVYDDDVCDLIWQDNMTLGGDVRHKTHTSQTVSGFDFVLSDETPDRLGDIIMAGGWDLTNFKKNPVALWGHRSDMPPIGLWHDLRIDGSALRGRLELAPVGTSDRIDEIRKLVDAGILKAVS